MKKTTTLRTLNHQDTKKALQFKKERQTLIEEASKSNAFTKDIHELLEYADYLKRMIDEIELDEEELDNNEDNDDGSPPYDPIEEQRLEVQKKLRKYKDDNYKGVG